MKIYVIKDQNDVSQAQLNVSGARDISRLRTSTMGNVLIEVNDTKAEEYFLNDKWYTIEEIRLEMEKPEWNGEAQGFVSKFMGIFKG